MRRWAIRVAQLLSLLWATLFLTANLLHPLTHNPLQHDGSDCLVCVLHKTASAEPPKAHTHNPHDAPAHGRVNSSSFEPTASLERIASRPQIPRAPPA
jgi:hypothetical protein